MEREHAAFSRIHARWQLHPRHWLSVAIAPTYVTRGGEDRLHEAGDGRDPLSAERKVFSLVGGLEYEAHLAQDVIENVAFVKDYLQHLRAEEATLQVGFRRYDRDPHRVGFGDALRVRITQGLYAKLSYEWATRLPRAAEIFGDVLVRANLELEPETSHNLNLGVALIRWQTAVGAFRGELNGFTRDAKQLIVLWSPTDVSRYENIFGARALGLEGTVGWSSPGGYLVLDANATYLDFRNRSGEGKFARYEGQRLPNRPYLFANASARVEFGDLAVAGDALALLWNLRFVDRFYRGWEDIGLRASKQYVPAQWLHGLALNYRVEGDRVSLGFTAELENLTDAKAYDFIGVQRPGRAFYFKVTAAI